MLPVLGGVSACVQACMHVCLCACMHDVVSEWGRSVAYTSMPLWRSRTSAFTCANRARTHNRLHNYDAAVYGDGKAPKLVDFPPPIEAVACKPVLFDLALNKALYPDLTSRAQKKKGGILGWFGRK